MNTVSKLFSEPSAIRLERTLKELVLAFNNQRLDILNRYKVGELEVDIIRFLEEHEQKKMKEVGDYFKIKLSTLTSTIDKLEKNRLVKRKSSKEDRRVIYIKPTPKGQALLNDLVNSTHDVAEQVIHGIKGPEYDAAIKVLDKTLDLMKK
ncbi:MAG: MarR family transcriptional regulator [Bacteroidia bacterium]|nr:MarR family transcriptional regulator [Bacteroidia bacterium]